LSDGSVLTASNILVRVNADTFTWQPTNLTVNGEPIADLPPAKITTHVNTLVRSLAVCYHPSDP
jgi:hypothetical protein